MWRKNYTRHWMLMFAKFDSSRFCRPQSAQFNTPLECILRTTQLDDGVEAYKALSYVWGDPDKRTPLTVNGRDVPVTINLESALRYVRDKTEPVVLWADAVCINQDDEEEKGRQVSLMGSIYREADLVIAWLGEAGHDSDLIMDIPAASLPQEEQDDDDSVENKDSATKDKGTSNCQGSSLSFDVEQYTAEQSAALKHPMQRDYWSRLWVVQEVLLAKTVVFKCGNDSVSGRLFYTMLEKHDSGFNMELDGRFQKQSGHWRDTFYWR